MPALLRCCSPNLAYAGGFACIGAGNADGGYTFTTIIQYPWGMPAFASPGALSVVTTAASIAFALSPPSLPRYLSYFRDSGKFTVAFMKQGGEKEYYLASACQEVYAPPSASISLRGFAGGWDPEQESRKGNCNQAPGATGAMCQVGMCLCLGAVQVKQGQAKWCRCSNGDL
jgi:hypothetical protein